MPSISVALNGLQLAQVCTDGLNVLSVRVHGTRVDEGFADLEMSGGRYPEQGESTHLIWIDSVTLKPGDTVEVTLSEGGVTAHAGKTINELFPSEQGSEENIERTPTVDMFRELRAKQQVRGGYVFSVTTSEGLSYAGRTVESEHGFGFSLVWHSWRSERANLSLHSYTIDSMEHKLPMRDHVREYVQPPHSVVLRVDG